MFMACTPRMLLYRCSKCHGQHSGLFPPVFAQAYARNHKKYGPMRMLCTKAPVSKVKNIN